MSSDAEESIAAHPAGLDSNALTAAADKVKCQVAFLLSGSQSQKYTLAGKESFNQFDKRLF